MTLTDRTFWLNYWESKEGLIFKVPNKYPFLPLIRQLVATHPTRSALELGGFPGYYSVWMKKHLNTDTTLLDYVVHPKILHDLERANGLPEGSVGVIETDLFQYTPRQGFDLVMSNGLIEHFDDTENIIEKHVESLTPGGTLLITLPNFRGLNGWFQKTFDPENYAKHNIQSMDLDRLRKAGERLGLKNIQVYYDGRFMLWLEREHEKPLLGRILRKVLWLPLKVFFKLVPVETKAFSPYIVLTATK
ncbi:class I SAM-dependent methyltransferase [Larkinella insperata]|uniref:Class I SAM-dependent methyltransferase n=1 Tax=Larkinella insperata TaxID=332158 RepID=A0ABW3QGU3_9BACT|nr:methyltransferase domain-containing protein [Larkinella insperata]